MIICGIDPGLERTGYAVLTVRGESASVIDAGLVRAPRDAPLACRLEHIAAGIEEVLDEHAPALVGLEELYGHLKHPRTAILMGHARGVILLAAARRNIPAVHLPATHIKRALTGNGRAPKTQIQRAIMRELHLSTLPEPPDLADALAVALCAAWLRTAPPAQARTAVP